MKDQILKGLFVCLFGLSACTSRPASPQVTAESTQSTSVSVPVKNLSLKTAMGEFNIAFSRFVDEVNGVTPGPKDKILLIGLTRPGAEKLDHSTFSLEEFQTMIQETPESIYILGDDGSKTISTMAGWVGPEYDEFAIGFRLQSSITSYKLYWPDNDPIDIVPEN